MRWLSWSCAPFVQCESLDGTTVALSEVLADSLTVLGCSGSKLSQPMVDGWLENVLNALPSGAAAPAPATGPGKEGVDPGMAPIPSSKRPLSVAWLSLVDDPVFGWLKRPLLATMRMAIPDERHSSFYTHFGDTATLRRQIRMENRYLGYGAHRAGQSPSL